MRRNGCPDQIGITVRMRRNRQLRKAMRLNVPLIVSSRSRNVRQAYAVICVAMRRHQCPQYFYIFHFKPGM